MRKGLVISAVGHVAVLTWALVSFSSRSWNSASESLPVDVVSSTEFSQIMNGQRNAPQAEKPKPLVEKIAEPKPADEPTAKVSEKKEIAPTKTAAPPPPAPEAKPEPKPERAKKEPTQPDPIVEALKKEKEEAKKPVKAEAKPAPKKPTQEYVFDPTKTAALLDKRVPQRHAAAGDVLNSTATLGLASGKAMTLSESEIDALRRQIQACWAVPVGAADAKELTVTIRLMLKQDGSLAAEPTLMNRGSGSFFQVYAESALRAIRRCQPYRLPIAKYEVWKDVEVSFRPTDMFGG
jgi:outer membrane biosynthesis protein TonB